MVKIITGKKDGGKSTAFLRLYREMNGKGEIFSGLFSRKLYDNAGEIIGYNLVFLPSGQEIPFVSLKESIIQKDSKDYYFQGRFAFRKETFGIAERYILDSIHMGATSVWIDEVGNLELKGVGYDTLLQTLLKLGININFTVRDDLLEKVIKRYNIKKYLLIDSPASI